MQTQTMIPHRDVVLKIIRSSKKIIGDFNSENLPGCRAIPVFPLWSFAESFPEDVFEVKVENPKLDGTTFYFPLVFCTEGKPDVRTEFRIVFARISGDPHGIAPYTPPTETAVDFPLNVSCYRTGTAVIEDNSWKLFDEKWHKIPGN
ncbi:MAG: hypothetical protein II584_01495 [Treponema sp.]|nr:hypothetical protein [Treponema sp.]